MQYQYGFKIVYLWQEVQGFEQDSHKGTGKRMHPKCPFLCCLPWVLFWTSKISKLVWEPTVSHTRHHLLFHALGQSAILNLWEQLWFCFCILMWTRMYHSQIIHTYTVIHMNWYTSLSPFLIGAYLNPFWFDLHIWPYGIFPL